MVKKSRQFIKASIGQGYPLFAFGVAAIFVLMPFHALLTVWLAQLVGHYTALRLWKEVLLAVLAAGAAILVARDKKLQQALIKSWLVRLTVLYLGAQVIWGIVALMAHSVTLTALGYGWVSDTRYLLFFLAVWVIAARAPQLHEHWPKLVFWPAAVVVAFGLLQYFVLPYDFLRHLGYSSATIFPYEDINHNIHYIRIMSTLRGSNPLGAYLVMVLSLLLAWRRKQKWWWYVFVAAGVLALLLTFSRAAWIGMGASVMVLVVAAVRIRHLPRLVPAAVVAVVVLAGGLFLLLHDNTTLQNIVFHTQSHSAVATTSDQGHASALQSGLHDAIHEPLGRGPGTAGPASVYNTGHPLRIAENYYIQIAQDTGWFGLGIFLAILIVVARMLWRSRSEPLALGLLAALAGISIVNLFSHAWADDTLVYLWWGLCAISLAAPKAVTPKQAIPKPSKQSH